MSISDTIVVMQEGRIMQQGEPQLVYDKPENLFVAKFLGTPQINVFNGEIRTNGIYIGEDRGMELPESVKALAIGSADISMTKGKKVYVAVRPEGFEPDNSWGGRSTSCDMRLICEFRKLEVMGRDSSILSAHKAMDGAVVRSIITSGTEIKTPGGEIAFKLKPGKVHVFDAETGKVIE